MGRLLWLGQHAALARYGCKRNGGAGSGTRWRGAGRRTGCRSVGGAGRARGGILLQIEDSLHGVRVRVEVGLVERQEVVERRVEHLAIEARECTCRRPGWRTRGRSAGGSSPAPSRAGSAARVPAARSGGRGWRRSRPADTGCGSRRCSSSLRNPRFCASKIWGTVSRPPSTTPASIAAISRRAAGGLEEHVDLGLEAEALQS